MTKVAHPSRLAVPRNLCLSCDKQLQPLGYPKQHGLNASLVAYFSKRWRDGHSAVGAAEKRAPSTVLKMSFRYADNGTYSKPVLLAKAFLARSTEPNLAALAEPATRTQQIKMENTTHWMSAVATCFSAHPSAESQWRLWWMRKLTLSFASHLPKADEENVLLGVTVIKHCNTLLKHSPNSSRVPSEERIDLGSHGRQKAETSVLLWYPTRSETSYG